MFDEFGDNVEVVVTYFTLLSRNFSRGNFSQGIRCLGRVRTWQFRDTSHNLNGTVTQDAT